MRFACIPLDVLRDFAARHYTCQLSLEANEHGEVVYKVAGLQAGTVRPAVDIVRQYYDKRRGLWRPTGPPPPRTHNWRRSSPSSWRTQGSRSRA